MLSWFDPKVNISSNLSTKSAYDQLFLIKIQNRINLTPAEEEAEKMIQLRVCRGLIGVVITASILIVFPANYHQKEKTLMRLKP